MALQELLVEMLRREVAIALAVEIVHPFKLARRRPPRRHLADPPIAQSLDPVLLIAHAQPSELPPRQAQ
jgi:hypothetical protein